MEAEVRLLMASPAEAEICNKAMSVGEKPGSRSTQKVRAEGSYLILDVSANDLGALRAALNSSLREIKIANDLIL